MNDCSVAAALFHLLISPPLIARRSLLRRGNFVGTLFVIARSFSDVAIS